MYEDWDKRPAGLTQIKIIGGLQDKVQGDSQSRVCGAAALADSRTGQCVRFSDDGRGSRQYRPWRAAEGRPRDPAKGARRAGFPARRIHHLQRRQSATLSRYQSHDGGVARSHNQRRLHRPSRPTWGRPTSTCSTSSTRAFRFACRRGATTGASCEDISNLYVANRDGQMVPLGALIAYPSDAGSELVTRYNLYPAASIIGVADARLQFRPGARHDGARSPSETCRWEWTTNGPAFPTRRS